MLFFRMYAVDVFLPKPSHVSPGKDQLSLASVDLLLIA